MCDAMTEPPRPGVELYTYWPDEHVPVEGDECDLSIGDWTLRVRINKVKDSVLADKVHVSMTVIG
jgi:hypothetical protein